MKIILKSSIFVFFLSVTQMSYAGSFIDSATVVSVDKVYKQVRVEEPYQECYIKETVQNNGDGSATNEIIGGVIGGAIGNQFGDGSGKDIMTLAGILMGASIANDAEKAAANGKQTIVSQEVCEKKVRQKIEKRLSHYKVTVDYNGTEVSFSSKRRPYDDVIKVEVSVDGLD
ncbi:glycine zipper 2TM domain-containing protein [Candidatus Pseudothioglobus singularis]|nr:glycine zipper 2TM domain-containing protein [Candidatus Pseudothioglobus singularis]